MEQITIYGILGVGLIIVCIILLRRTQQYAIFKSLYLKANEALEKEIKWRKQLEENLETAHNNRSRAEQSEIKVRKEIQDATKAFRLESESFKAEIKRLGDELFKENNEAKGWQERALSAENKLAGHSSTISKLERDIRVLEGRLEKYSRIRDENGRFTKKTK